MITTDSTIEMLREAREEKLALTVVIGLMTDSLETSVLRLEELLPKVKELEKESRKRYGKKPLLDINHDIALKVCDIVEEILPWLKKVAELETEGTNGALDIPQSAL